MEKMAARSIEWDDLTDDLRSIHDYWKSLTGERIAPAWSNFDLTQCPSRLLPTTIVLDVINNKDRGSKNSGGGHYYRFRFFGSGLTQAHGREMTGKLVTDLPNKEPGELLHVKFDTVVTSKTFDFAEIGIEVDGRFSGLQRSGRWPLSDDGKTITGIVSAIDMEISRREMKEIVGEHDDVPDNLQGSL